MTTTTKIRKPAAWTDSMESLLEIEAGQAYVLDQLDSQSQAIQPEHTFTHSKHPENCYEVYPDGSLWFVNNAEDEVWSDFRSFVSERLTDLESDGIEADEMDERLIALAAR